MRRAAKQLKSVTHRAEGDNPVTNRLLAALLGFALAIANPAFARETAPAATADPLPIIDYRQRFVPTVARGGMVVSPERLAAEVGLAILQEGGNAVDAAVATGFALAVTYPRAGNLGGGGFMLVHLAEEGREVFIDYRETAPAAATRDLFLGEDGEPDRLREYFSHQSAGVPGTVAGLLHALDTYGTISELRLEITGTVPVAGTTLSAVKALYR